MSLSPTIVPQGTTIYFKSNFENNSLAEWDVFVVVGGLSQVNIIENSFITGKRVLKSYVDDSILSRAYIMKTGLNLNALWGRFTVRFSANSLFNNETIQIAGLRKSNNIDIIKIKLKKISNRYNLGVIGNSTVWGTTDLNIDKNYRIEFRYSKNTNFQIWIEGVLQATITEGLNNIVDRLVIGLICDSIRESTCYYDEIYLVNHRLGPITRTLFMDDPRIKHRVNLRDPKGHII